MMTAIALMIWWWWWGWWWWWWWWCCWWWWWWWWRWWSDDDLMMIWWWSDDDLMMMMMMMTIAMIRAFTTKTSRYNSCGPCGRKRHLYIYIYIYTDDETRSGGHPRTHSGVTSTHRHNFASFFPPRVTRAHRLESRAHTAIFQSHPRTQTGVTSTHRTILHHFFHPESPAHTSHGIGWGGDDDILLHLHTCSKRCAMDCFGTYFTHVQPVM